MKQGDVNLIARTYKASDDFHRRMAENGKKLCGVRPVVRFGKFCLAIDGPKLFSEICWCPGFPCLIFRG